MKRSFSRLGCTAVCIGLSLALGCGCANNSSLSHNVRLPDTEELFGDGVTVKPSVDLNPEISNNINLGLPFRLNLQLRTLDLLLHVEVGNARYISDSVLYPVAE